MMAIQLLTWIPPTFCSVLFCSLCNRLHRNVCFEIMYVCIWKARFYRPKSKSLISEEEPFIYLSQ